MTYRHAIIQHFIDANTVPKRHISFENADFTIPSEPWVRLTLIPISHQPSSLGIGGLDRDRAILRINLFQAKGSGEAFKLRFWDTLRRHFFAGKCIHYAGQCVTIEKLETQTSTVADGYYQSDFDCVFYSFWQRPTLQ